jgi:hypothetical protein
MPETARHRETEISNKKYCETTVGELRKTYGAPMGPVIQNYDFWGSRDAPMRMGEHEMNVLRSH